MTRRAPRAACAWFTHSGRSVSEPSFDFHKPRTARCTHAGPLAAWQDADRVPAGPRAVSNLPYVDMCPLHLSNGGSTILMLGSVILKVYELLAYTTTGALGTAFRYS